MWRPQPLLSWYLPSPSALKVKFRDGSERNCKNYNYKDMIKATARMDGHSVEEENEPMNRCRLESKGTLQPDPGMTST